MELQLTRAMLVVQHPILEAQLLSDEKPQQLVASILARSMLAGLDKYISQAEADNSNLNIAELENLTFQLQHVSYVDSSSGSAYYCGVLHACDLKVYGLRCICAYGASNLQHIAQLAELPPQHHHAVGRWKLLCNLEQCCVGSRALGGHVTLVEIACSGAVSLPVWPTAPRAAAVHIHSEEQVVPSAFSRAGVPDMCAAGS